ncbi:unnamed protein product [Sphagnum jensenii]|uniref:Uncharacterized protein n=1 Tax=Sphagnum jensenii TaxID=128206 RepID=A0ABP0XDK4_9BRYO
MYKCQFGSLERLLARRHDQRDWMYLDLEDVRGSPRSQQRAARFMDLASKYQPSQLAEEQRTASRFHKLLATPIQTTLLIDPRLRKDAHVYIEHVMVRLQALDVGFPLPLNHNDLEKFPKL